MEIIFVSVLCDINLFFLSFVWSGIRGCVCERTLSEDERMSQLSNFVGRKQGHPVVELFLLDEDQTRVNKCSSLVASHYALFSPARREISNSSRHARASHVLCSRAFWFLAARRIYAIREIKRDCCGEMLRRDTSGMTDGLAYDLFIRKIRFTASGVFWSLMPGEIYPLD